MDVAKPICGLKMTDQGTLCGANAHFIVTGVSPHGMVKKTPVCRRHLTKALERWKGWVEVDPITVSPASQRS